MTLLSNKIIYGGDYYPEQWLDRPDILKKDIEFLKIAGMNTVTLGVFAWSMLEPEEGIYQLDWLEQVINNLYANGISVILATPSGARPKWLSDKYPEVLRVREDRRRNLFGERHNHCYTSLIYRDKVAAINTKLAERFAENPAVILWHISNEYGGECHCPLCQQAFRNWLRKRYGTIEQLNQKWWTRFWSHTYRSFDEIESPSTIGEQNVHGLNLDWKRFVTDQTADFMKQEIEALRKAGAKQPVTTNMMYDYQGLNYGKMAEYVDIISWDAYPLWHKKPDIQIAMDTGMQHDYMRSLKKRPFLLMESCPTAPNWQGVSKLKKSGLLMNASLQTIAHGGDSVQYFQIRQSRGGSEKFHGAVIDHYGEQDTRAFKEISEIGKVLGKLSDITGSEVKAQAALIYDVESRWAMEDAQGPRNNGLYYHESAMKSYQALRRYGLDVDVIDMDQPLTSYKVAVAPMLYMFRSGIEDKVRKFVKNGGILIMTYWSGVVDETDLCFLGKTPHDLSDVLGLRREEIDGLYDGETNVLNPVRGNELGIDKSYSCTNLCELVKLEGAVSMMEYGEDFYSGKAGLTKNIYGSGEAYYICADMEEDFYTDVYKKILKQAGIREILPNIPKDVEVSIREDENYQYVFIQNYAKEPVAITLPLNCEVLEGEYDGMIQGMSTIVIRIPKEN